MKKARIGKWERIAHELGFEIRHDHLGFYACTFDEGDHEDEGKASVGFDGRSHYQSVEQAAKEQVHAASD